MSLYLHWCDRRASLSVEFLLPPEFSLIYPREVSPKAQGPRYIVHYESDPEGVSVTLQIRLCNRSAQPISILNIAGRPESSAGLLAFDTSEPEYILVPHRDGLLRMKSVLKLPVDLGSHGGIDGWVVLEGDAVPRKPQFRFDLGVSTSRRLFRFPVIAKGAPREGSVHPTVGSSPS